MQPDLSRLATDIERQGLLPSLISQQEAQMEIGGETARAALREIARISRQISQLGPNDPETLSLMLSLRRTYAQAAENYICRQFGIGRY